MGGTVELVESKVSERTRWHVVVLRVGGHVAVGECSDAGASDVLCAELEAATEALVARDLLDDRGEVLDELAARVPTRGEHTFAAATVMGGLAQALVDLAAQDAGEPVWKWLGAAAPDPIRLYANINRVPGGRAPADVADAARRAVSAGFDAVKCAPFDVPVPGTDLATAGLDRLVAVRDAIGDDVGLMVDCHERLPVVEVLRILPALSDLGIHWLEDAVDVSDLDGLRTLRAASGLTLAGGEKVFDPALWAPAVDEQLLDVLMPDVKHAGGIERVLDVARGAGTVAVSPHNPSGPVATAASAHAMAACPGASTLEFQFGEADWRSELVGGAERVVDGRLVVSDRPGLGLALEDRHPSTRTLWSTTL